MAGNAPAAAVRLSTAPLPALILRALNRPPLPHHHEATIHLETVGKEYSPDPFFLLGKEKKPMNFRTTFLLEQFLSLKHMIPGQASSMKNDLPVTHDPHSPQNNPTVIPEPPKGGIFWGFCFPVTIQLFLPKMRSFPITQGWASALALMLCLQQNCSAKHCFALSAQRGLSCHARDLL